MSYSYQKYNSAEGAATYTAAGLNRMNFKIDEVNGLTDLSKSYNILNVSIASTDYKKDGVTPITGVVNPWRWGNNGVKYNASSLIRNIRLDSNKGALENIINQNQWTQSVMVNLLTNKSQQKSQDILNFYSGATHGSSSMFNASPWINYNTDGSITTPTSYAAASVIMPLKETALGLAQVGAINLAELEHNNLSLRYELEDIANVLDLSWESTTNVAVTLGQTLVGSPRTLCYQEQFQGSYNQTIGDDPVIYTINVTRPIDWRAAADDSQSSFPFSNNYGLTNAGLVSVSYMGNDGNQHTTIATVVAIETEAATASLQITAALPYTNNTDTDGGISTLAIKALVGGITDNTTLSTITVSVPRPLNTVAASNCPFNVNMTIQVFGDNLNAATQNQVFKITAITQTPPLSFPAGSSAAVDSYVLTLDSPLVLITPAATTVYMCPSVNASASWSISSPLLTLSTLTESPEMKIKRSQKTSGAKTFFSTYEMESFTWSAASTNLMRQWILSPQTVCATLLSPLNGSLVSVRDNVNQIRVILGGNRLINKPIILNNYTSAGSQYTDWLKDVLQHYAGLSVQQIQQIPTDAPGQVMVVPAGIQDMRFSSVGDDRKEPYILEYQLYSPTGSPMSAKTWYVFKTVVKHL